MYKKILANLKILFLYINISFLLKKFIVGLRDSIKLTLCYFGYSFIIFSGTYK
jgi:hypothetical protein